MVLAALNNLWPLFHGRRALVAFAFGLIHGFGFASVLLDLGLPKASLLLSLVGFNLLTGLRMRHVPYKDVQQALGDVSAQRVTVMISNLPPAMALVRAGKLRPMAVTTRTRSGDAP